MPAPSFRTRVLATALELARARGWVTAATPRSRYMRLSTTSRIGLQTRGRIVIASVIFALDPDAAIDTPDALAGALGAGLADVTLAVAGRVAP